MGAGWRRSAVEDFGSQHVGTSAKRTLRITNEGAEDYSLGAVTVSSQWVKGADGCGAKTLAAGASCDVEVTFAPTTGGVKAGFVTITNHKPHLIALAGVGTEAVAGALAGGGGPELRPADLHAAQHGQRGARGRHARIGAGFAIGADTCSRRRSPRAQRAR